MTTVSTQNTERQARKNALLLLGDHQVGLYTGVREIDVLQLKHNVVGLNKVTIGETSGHHPAMAVGVDQVPYFCWAGSGFPLLNPLHSESGTTNGFLASPNYKRTFYDTADNGPCVCAFKGKMFIAWTGTDFSHHVNVAQLSRGAVAVYGHLR